MLEKARLTWGYGVDVAVLVTTNIRAAGDKKAGTAHYALPRHEVVSPPGLEPGIDP